MSKRYWIPLPTLLPQNKMEPRNPKITTIAINQSEATDVTVTEIEMEAEIVIETANDGIEAKTE